MEREQSRDTMTDLKAQSNLSDQAPEAKPELVAEEVQKSPPNVLSPPVQPVARGRMSLFRK
jgi:hypothetical protein